MPSPELLIFAINAVFLAGIIQGLTGFGFGIVVVPILTIFISPKLVAPVTLINATVLNTLIVQRTYQHVDLKRIWPLILSGLAGVPVGTWILVHADVDILRVYIGIATTLIAVIFLAGFQRQVQHEKLAFVPIGITSGVMSGSINMSGPPVILFFTNQGMARQVFRATIVAYFLILSLSTYPWIALGGLLTKEALLTAVIVSPALVAGGLIGNRLVPRVDEAAVRHLTLVIVLLAGITSVLNGLGVL